MTIKVGINGMGRIGRMVIRAIIENQNKNIEIKHNQHQIFSNLYLQYYFLEKMKFYLYL